MYFYFEYLPAPMTYGFTVEWSQVDVDLSDTNFYAPFGDKIISKITSDVVKKTAYVALAGELFCTTDVATIVDRIMSAIAPRIKEAAQNDFVSETVLTHLRHELKKYFTKTLHKENDLYYPDVPAPSDASTELSNLSRELPGVNSTVYPPCFCENKVKQSVWAIVQHLNDSHKDWSRERIADWLDELHDTGQVNIEFQVEVEE